MVLFYNKWIDDRYFLNFLRSLAAQREQYLRAKAIQISQYQRALSAQVRCLFIPLFTTCCFVQLVVFASE